MRDVRKVKRVIMVLIASFLGATNISYGQDTLLTDYRVTPNVGFKAGTNYSNTINGVGETFVSNARLGFASGGFITIPVTREVGVQPEVLFSQKGFHATGRLLNATYDLTRTTSYLDIPFYISYKPIEFLSILAGPQYSYLIKQKDNFKNASTSIEQQIAFGNDNIRKHTLCLAAGADLNIKHVVISARGGIDLLRNNIKGIAADTYLQE